MDLAGLRSDGGKASWISVRLRCLSPGQDTGNPLKLSYVASSGRVFLNRVPDETAEPDSTSSGYIYCPSRLYWSAKACYLGGDLRSCRCGFLALSISLSQFQTQEKIYIHLQRIDNRKNKISHLWLHHLTDENECISYIKMLYSWSFIDVKLWQPFLRSQRTKCNSFTVELQEFLAQLQEFNHQTSLNMPLFGCL
ncbi:hypothetical protein OPV22_029394 [Ensete ventricosum]|uniref:Uncharacterized protein n=1 Tax=Ensete ventricosum TaxID=4639 RepID=A0AAV8P7A1_ENSVE|nr:hypothetical protein OPV22_029394 [Ensete ventricosum]